MKGNKAKIKRLKAKFKRLLGFHLNLENPQTLSEKIQWLKLYGNLERYAKYVDKYEVRRFVEERIGEEYLIPNFGVYNSVDDIDLENLPDSVVMKATHGSNWNVFVPDKSSMDWNKEKKRLRELLKIDYSKRTGQPNYKIKGRVTIDKYLRDPSGDLKNYKFFCFHGKIAFILVIGKGFTKGDLYDTNWQRIPVKYIWDHFNEPLEKPKHLNELITVAEKLAAGFPFVRVDLYYTNDQIYFGELTFTPANGYLKFKPQSYDKTLGQLLDLSKYKKEV